MDVAGADQGMYVSGPARRSTAVRGDVATAVEGLPGRGGRALGGRLSRRCRTCSRSTPTVVSVAVVFGDGLVLLHLVGRRLDPGGPLSGAEPAREELPGQLARGLAEVGVPVGEVPRNGLIPRGRQEVPR